MAAAQVVTEHTDMVHDAQLDFFGKTLATCSSDRTIKIFKVTPDTEQHTLVKELRGHDGPVWKVAWAHPMFGQMLASCSHDAKVMIWKDGGTGWERIYTCTDHLGSVNSISWGPHSLGKAVLACASSDGDITILRQEADGRWVAKRRQTAHKEGALALSWAPTLLPGPLGKEVLPDPSKPASRFRLVSGGQDGKVQLWELKDDWELDFKETLKCHEGTVVRDVAWAPSIGLSTSMIATCAQDGKVFVHSEIPGSEWKSVQLVKPEEDTPAWSVSWSQTGGMLAVSSADNKVTIFKQALTGKWESISDISQ